MTLEQYLVFLIFGVSIFALSLYAFVVWGEKRARKTKKG